MSAPERVATGSGLTSLTLHNLASVVSDLDRALGWYSEVLGFELESRVPIPEGEVAVMTGAGTRLELLCASAMKEAGVRLPELFAEPPAHTFIVGNKFLVFQVDDLARASAELEAKGVTFLWREKELAPGWVATAIRDFDQNLINIFQR